MYQYIDLSIHSKQIIITNIDNIGLDKVDVCSDRCKSINEDIEIIKIKKKLDSDNIYEIFNYDIDLFDRLDRNEYFYLPGRVLHIDGDIYLNNNALNPYKIRKNEKINNDKNNIKKKKIGNFS